MRVTEQGEVVSAKFANRGTALHNLEILSAAVLAHTMKSEDEAALKDPRSLKDNPDRNAVPSPAPRPTPAAGHHQGCRHRAAACFRRRQ